MQCLGEKRGGGGLCGEAALLYLSNAEKEQGSHDLRRLEKAVCIPCRNAHRTSLTTACISGHSELIIWLLGSFDHYQVSWSKTGAARVHILRQQLDMGLSPILCIFTFSKPTLFETRSHVSQACHVDYGEHEPLFLLLLLPPFKHRESRASQATSPDLCGAGVKRRTP